MRGDAGPAGGRRRGAFSRRQLLAGSGAAVAGLAAASVADPGAAGAVGAAPGPVATVPFYGPHQAGIATPSQEHLVFAAYDLATESPRALGSLLAAWTKAAARLAVGEPLTGDDRPDAAPPDTGEALGLGPANLTVTVGFGPGLFDHRLGLAHLHPAALADLPAFPLDALDPSLSGGDLCVQACADDPQVAFHAVHNLTRLALGTATLRYTQLGFGMRSPGTVDGGPQTPRNLLGFHDGTANRQVLDPGGLEQVVWVGQGGDQPWMAGGTYLVARRIRVYLEAWARTPLESQEAAVGRRKASGAPLGGHDQFDRMDLEATGPGGLPVIPASAHVRLASAAHTGGAQILRRSFNFADGVDPSTGELDAGLYFLCFQRDPTRGFVPIQQNLASDALTGGYLLHTSSAVFACPPGLTEGSHWGEVLGLG
ncbi:MAG: iron uptake transporter deferrochelatase/peroxidase subunit [Acidimicrobiales bacterium]